MSAKRQVRGFPDHPLGKLNMRMDGTAFPIVRESPRMTAGEVARMLGITRQAVYLRALKGTLPVMGRTPEGVFIFPRSEIEKLRDSGGAGDGDKARAGSHH